MLMARHEIKIPDWHPAKLNELISKGWRTKHRLKTRDKNMVATYVLAQAVPAATGRRRVSLLIVLGKGHREPDPDAYWKSTLDALKQAEMLTDDDRKGCVMGEVEFVRSRDGSCSTTIILEDVAPAAKTRRLKKGEVA